MEARAVLSNSPQPGRSQDASGQPRACVLWRSSLTPSRAENLGIFACGAVEDSLQLLETSLSYYVFV
ncbi:hypothetical protein AAY473_029131 [Plecturocebus cupreus]